VRTAAALSFLLDALQRLVNLALTFAILGALLLFGAQFVHAGGFQSAWPVLTLHRFGDPFVLRLTTLLHLPGLRTWMPLVLAAAVYLLILVSDQLFGVLHSFVQMLRTGPLRRPAQATAAQAGVESEKAREQLYKEYRKIEKTLKEAKRKQCSFLSVDVVGSTGMKNGETEIAITSTFRAYEELLKRTFKATHAWKESWTPDGVMICFLNREDAIEAGKTILEKLLPFNAGGGNALKTRFDVRCGVNEGEVVVFEDSDLEKLVEHVIDVAGHMQKHAKPGTLWLSKELYEVLEDSGGFEPTGQEVDGYQTYQWTPKNETS
jgi:class 3 adenylate cyclase